MSILTPKRWKYRKQMRGRISGVATRGNKVSFGDFGLKATTSAYVSNRQLEAARKVIVRYTRKVGKLWFRVFPDVPYTKKGLEMPMGSGKGDVDHYQARIKKGGILFEVSGLDRATAEEAFKMASYKLPMTTRIVEKGEVR